MLLSIQRIISWGCVLSVLMFVSTDLVAATETMTHNPPLLRSQVTVPENESFAQSIPSEQSENDAIVLPKDPVREVVTIASVLKEAVQSVVSISVQGRTAARVNPLLRDPFFKKFFHTPSNLLTREPISAGSGVIVDAEQGYVVTSHHIIQYAEHVTVTLMDQRKITAKIIGSDRETDIALLQIDVQNLKSIELGESDTLEVGDFVVAVGNPFGLGHTVTYGMVSAHNRVGHFAREFENYLHIDVAINAGNSGGALIDTHGKLVGINTAKPANGQIGYGFAVPSTMVVAIMKQLIQHGEVLRGSIGLSVQDLTYDLIEAFDVPISRGVIVTEIVPNSSTAQSPIKVGDIIVALNGVSIENASNFRSRVGILERDTFIEITYYQKGAQQTSKIRVDPLPEITLQGETLNPRVSGGVFSEIPEDLRRYRNVQGIYIKTILPGSNAWHNGLRQGDIILRINRYRITSLQAFQQVMPRMQRRFNLYLLRNSKQVRISIP